MSKRARCSCLLALLLTTTSAVAEPTPVDRATAQQLYDDARKLVAEGKLAEACPKLAESQRLDPALGTQLRLADCFEKKGQLASAWATFLDAADLAQRTKDPREKIARERVAALAGRLPKLVVKPVDPTITGLEISRDGQPLGRALWGSASPVDPGSHTIEASAPGKAPFRATVVVVAGGPLVVLEVPALGVSASSATSPPPDASGGVPTSEVSPPATTGMRPVLGYALGGAGVVSGVVGAVLYFSAKSKHDSAAGQCQSGVDAAGPYNTCSGDARSSNDSAKTTGAIGDVMMGVGGALVVTGVVLLLTAPRRSPTAIRVAPTVGGDRAGLVVGGAW